MNLYKEIKRLFRKKKTKAIMSHARNSHSDEYSPPKSSQNSSRRSSNNTNNAVSKNSFTSPLVLPKDSINGSKSVTPRLVLYSLFNNTSIINYYYYY